MHDTQRVPDFFFEGESEGDVPKSDESSVKDAGPVNLGSDDGLPKAIAGDEATDDGPLLEAPKMGTGEDVAWCDTDIGPGNGSGCDADAGTG